MIVTESSRVNRLLRCFPQDEELMRLQELQATLLDYQVQRADLAERVREADGRVRGGERGKGDVGGHGDYGHAAAANGDDDDGVESLAELMCRSVAGGRGRE